MAETIDVTNRRALSGRPMILAWIGMLIFACHASTHMVGAGDTWVAEACGRHFTNHGVDTVEPFSANSHKAGPTDEGMKKYAKQLRTSLLKDRPTGIKGSVLRWWSKKVDNYPNWPTWKKKFVSVVHPTGWVNQNWLTHVIFYRLTPGENADKNNSFSFNALVYWKFAIYILTIICVYYTGRLLGVNPALSAVFACFALFVGRSYFDIRPAGFSNLLVAVFLLILALTTYRNILYIWLIVPLTILWCNLHGGYLYVFIMLVPFIGLHFLMSFFPKWFVSIGKKGVYHTIGAGFVAFIGMLIFNPFHLTNLTHTFIISLSKHAEMWRNVNEWHPGFEWSNPVGMGFPLLVLFVLSIGVLVFWLFSRLMKPRLLKAPVNELAAQKRLFEIMLRVFSFGLAVLIGWIVFISFSFLNLDALSFFLCALFVGILLLSVYKNVHFIYAVILLSLIAMWTASGRGYLGRYFYPFVLLPSYVVIHILLSLFSKKVKFKKTNIIFVTAAAIVSLFLITVLFEPFGRFDVAQWPAGRFPGIFIPTIRTFFARMGTVIVSFEEFFHLSRPWRPPYEGNEAFEYKYLFSVLYIINVFSIVLWLCITYLKGFFVQLQDNAPAEPKLQGDRYELMKVDLALIIIAALTIYMAIRSRRFIPIAGIAACPVSALLIERMIRTISASWNFHNNKKLAVPSMPYNLQVFFIMLGAVAVVCFGTWWGLKFKYVYLDPWPTDTRLNSVFMRMTASHAKPFDACRFIRENKLKGKMFNYWTEGGFIAWSQEPDPETGKTPLQLFMDGRAQAAYEPEVFYTWTDIMAGGPVAYSAIIRKRELSKSDYLEVGKWVDQELKNRDVWIVLMPTNQFDKGFVIGLESHPDWQIVFMNNKQKLFVDITKPEGKKLYYNTFDPNSDTIYPNEFTRYLVLAHNTILFDNREGAKERGFNFAKKAFVLSNTQIALQKVLYADRIPSLKPSVIETCREYFDNFIRDIDKLRKEDGFHHKLVAAFVIADYLRTIAKQQKDEELEKYYEAKSAEFKKERAGMVESKIW